MEGCDVVVAHGLFSTRINILCGDGDANNGSVEMSKEKWMPPRLELEWYPESHLNKVEAKAIYDHAQRQFNSWYGYEIRSLFEKATVVYGRNGRLRIWSSDLTPTDTHEGILIKIDPIEKEYSAEDLLREMFAQAEKCEGGKYIFDRAFFERAKARFEGKK